MTRVLGKQKRAPFEVKAEEAHIERQAQQIETNLEEAPQRIIGKEPPFRGVRKSVPRAIYRGESPVVAVMPIGGGESPPFVLPARAVPRGAAVVMVPLIALRGDLR
jgi:superfamily II DNA helicase RecQ